MHFDANTIHISLSADHENAHFPRSKYDEAENTNSFELKTLCTVFIALYR